VVLVDRQVVRLSGLAVALLDGCAGWTDEDALAAQLVNRFGEPSDGASPLERTRTALSDLAAQGLVDLA
jgi:hypothetical protein